MFLRTWFIILICQSCTSLAQLSHFVCGVQGNNLTYTEFIVNGEDVKPFEWPWLVALYRKTRKGIKFDCGATLVSRNLAITAAHCVIGRKAEKFVVYLGRFNTELWGELDESLAKEVIRIILEPSYIKSKHIEGDLAILVFKLQVPYTSKVQPVCLPDPADSHQSRYNTLGTVVGWGRDENFNLVTTEPRKASLMIANNEECTDFNDNFKYITNSKTFCAGNEKGVGPCNGDSGGGFYVKTKTTGGSERWTLRGVVSRSLKLEDQDDCLDNSYYVFTDITKFIPWISEEIEDAYLDLDSAEIPDDKKGEEKRQEIAQNCVVEISKSEIYYNDDIKIKEKRLTEYQQLGLMKYENEVKTKEILKETTGSVKLIDLILFSLTSMKQKYKTNISGETKQKITMAMPIDSIRERIAKVFEVEQKEGIGALLNYVVSSVEIAKYMIASGADVYYNNGDSALTSATERGSLSVVKWLLENYQFDVNGKVKSGFTALHWAAIRNHLDIMKYLIEEAHADVDIPRNNNGATPLMFGVSWGWANIVAYLIKEAHANVHIKDEKGETALYWAAVASKLELLKYLILEGGADVNVQRNDGDTVLHEAAFWGRMEYMKFLVRDAHVDVNLKNKKGETPLQIARRRNETEFADWLENYIKQSKINLGNK